MTPDSTVSPETLPDAIRSELGGREDVEEKRMFGGHAFMLRGHMCAGSVRKKLVLRLGEEGTEQALREAHTAPMDFTGKPSRTMIFVDEEGYRSAADLRQWLRRAVAFVESLPPK